MGAMVRVLRVTISNALVPDLTLSCGGVSEYIHVSDTAQCETWSAKAKQLNMTLRTRDDTR